MDLPVLGILHEWDRTIRDLWCLATFTQPRVFSVYQLCSAYRYCIPFRGCRIFHSTERSRSVCPPTALGLLHLLLCTAPLQTCTCTHLFRPLLLILLVKNLARQLLGRMVIPFFRDHQTVFQKQRNRVTFPPAVYEASNFILANTCYFLLCFFFFQ